LLERKLSRAQLELAELRRINRRLLRSGGMNIDGVVEELLDIIKKEAPHFKLCPAPTKIAKPKLRHKPAIDADHYEVGCGAWSDWHLSETINWHDANRINAYDTLVCANRVWGLIQAEKQILSIHNAVYPIKKLYRFLLGDMINGTPHDEYRITNDLTDPAAAVLCARLIVGAINELKTLGIPIELHCVVGNHPRMTAKVPTKVQAQTSWDWVIYEWVSDAFTNDPQVNIVVHTGQLGEVSIEGWRFVIEHGIDWKNEREEDFEDRIRALFDDPTYRQATGLTGASFDQIVVGNLHKPAFMERTIKNGTLTGQNELGQSWRLKPIKAAQLMWGVSKGHVRTWEYQLDLTDIKDSRGHNPFLDYARGYMKRHGRNA